MDHQEEKCFQDIGKKVKQMIFIAIIISLIIILAPSQLLSNVRLHSVGLPVPKLNATFVLVADDHDVQQLAKNNLTGSSAKETSQKTFASVNSSQFNFLLSPQNANGIVLFTINVQEEWQKPIRIWKPQEEYLMFIHVYKAAGTSIIDALSSLQNKCKAWYDAKGEYFKNAMIFQPIQKKPCEKDKPIVYGYHYDWRIVSAVESLGYKTAPFIFLREPANTMVSHFYFAKNVLHDVKLQKHQTLDDYLGDKKAMLQTPKLWFDGTAGARWLTGTLPNLNGKISVKKRNNREILWDSSLNKTHGTCSSNTTCVLHTAINNLHKCLFLGIVEYFNQSIELLKYQTGLNLNLMVSNKNYHSQARPDQMTKIKQLMPMDIYLYEYAKQLFLHRWNWYLANVKNNAKAKESLTKIKPLVLPKVDYGWRKVLL